jgi:RNA polymerase sigma-70 factor (ECF subfamily)
MTPLSRKSTSRSDAELVRAIRTGDSDAAETLLARHWGRAWSAAYAVLGERAAAEDAAQSAVEKGLRALDRFDEARPFGPRLARISANHALNLLRTRRREHTLDVEIEAVDPYRDVVARDELVEAVGRLSEDRRVVVALRYWADLSPSEIAEALDLPIGTVSSRLSRAMDELRTILEEVEVR